MINDYRGKNRLTKQLEAGRKRKRKKQLVWTGRILLALFLLITFFVILSKITLSPLELTEPVSTSSEEPKLQEPLNSITEGTMRERGTFFQALAEKNVPSQWIDLIVSKLKPYLDFRKIKGGAFRLITDGNGELANFTFEAGPAEVYEVEKDSQGYIARKKEVPLKVTLTLVEGEIRSSLFEAMDAAGEQDQLTVSFAEILAWEVDFYKDVREGDRFKVLVEKAYKGKQFIEYGTIHALEYRCENGVVRGIEYQGSYYHEDGTSLRRAFLKVPLRFNRISSKFSRARRHPILGGILPHYGVDYAAPSGTPIWAVADGVVASCGWEGGFGKQVILRHMNGYKTYYGHLSRYGPRIRRGAHVRQKQIVGYVGSTGLSTGPHLDYRLEKDGRFRNPLRESFPSGIPIGKREIEAFEKRRDEMVGWLQEGAPSRELHPSLGSAKNAEQQR